MYTYCDISVKGTSSFAHSIVAECEKFFALLSVRCYLEFGSDITGLKTITRFFPTGNTKMHALFLCRNMSCAPNISRCLYLLFLCMCASNWRGIFTEYYDLERKLSAVTGPRGQP